MLGYVWGFYMRLVYALIIGYLSGSIPSSYLIGKLIGRVDLRKIGSGNLGTTNVIRNLGLAAGILAYVFDMLKGLIPVILLRHFWGFDAAVMAGVGTIVGHCYSIFFNFQGGKGVAVTSGVLFILDPVLALILIAGQLVVFFTTRYMGLASLITAVVFPIATYLRRGPDALFYASLFVSPFVIFQHRANLKRLIDGTEKKL